MKTLLSQALSLGLLVVLWLSILLGMDGLTTVAVTAYWVVIQLGLVLCVVLMVLSSLIVMATDPAKKLKLIQGLDKAAPTIGKAKKAYNWLCLALIVVGLAYGGWIFTAICYAVMGLCVRLCTAIGRDTIETSQGCAAI